MIKSKIKLFYTYLNIMKFNICFNLFLSVISLSTLAKTRTETITQITKSNPADTKSIAQPDTTAQTNIKPAAQNHGASISQDKPRSISRTKALDNYFSALHKNKQFNGNVLIAEKGKIIYEKSFGYADLEVKRLNNKNSSFPIASITKTITSTAVLQLKDKGKLKITDLVTKYIPEFPYPTLTIKHLLSQTSGMPILDDIFFPVTDKAPDTLLTNADLLSTLIREKLPLRSQPDEEFLYNNINFNILALLVERVSGLPFGEYLDKYVFKPARMSSSSLSHFFSRNDKNLSNLYAFKHTYSAKIEKPDTSAEFNTSRGIYRFNLSGHGDIISNTHDLLRYDQALYKGKLLKTATLKEAFTPVKLKNGTYGNQRYGLGWVIPPDTLLGKIVRHDGGLPGGRTILLRNTDRYQTIILFDNNANNVIPYANNALNILNYISVPRPKKNAAKIYGTSLANPGLTDSKLTLLKLRNDTLTYHFDEDEMNSLGYEFMADQQIENALQVFKTNIELFPSSWNVYDSYAEVLLEQGRKEDAIKYYQKSVELNPENENGRKILKNLVK